MDKITLPWANKFRELDRNCESDGTVVQKFLQYCEEKEKQINESWDREYGRKEK